MAFPPYQSDHLDGATPVAFTSREEIERLITYEGVNHHIDDLIEDDLHEQEDRPTENNPTNYLSEVIQRVTSRIMEQLAIRYEAKDLDQLPAIREIATYMAAHQISRRRGNQPLFEFEVAESIERLERYREGTLFLDAVAARPRVYVQQYIVHNKASRNPVRVNRQGSLQTVDGQRLVREYPFFWL